MNYIFVTIVCLFVAFSIASTYKLFQSRKWRYAFLNLILTILIPFETLLFVMQRDVLVDNEWTFFINELQKESIFAYVILFLNIFLIIFCITQVRKLEKGK